MLLSLLQLLAKKWSDLLKEIGHRLPQNRREYVELQENILREKVLENSIFDLRTHARIVVGANPGRGGYFSCVGGVEERPLNMCLGDIGGMGPKDSASASAGGGSSGGVCEVLGGHYLLDSDSHSDCSSDSDQHKYEEFADPISA